MSANILFLFEIQKKITKKLLLFRCLKKLFRPLVCYQNVAFLLEFIFPLVDFPAFGRLLPPAPALRRSRHSACSLILSAPDIVSCTEIIEKESRK